jgi:xanthine dehydrogenase large subunit
MSDAFEFILNARPVRVEGVSPNTTLLEFLRARGLTGSMNCDNDTTVQI